MCQSTVSLVLTSCTCGCTCVLTDSDDRQNLALTMVAVNLLMHAGVVVPLAVDPVAHRDIRAGQSSNSSSGLTGHPYYGLFVLDLVMMRVFWLLRERWFADGRPGEHRCKTAFGFILLSLPNGDCG